MPKYNSAFDPAPPNHIEAEELLLENKKLAVSVLIEDFKARWQELLNFENENSRWQTLYVTALLLVTSWVLTTVGPEGKYKTIGAIYAGENSYFLVSLALINAVYTLAMAYKGYQIHEIAQYLYSRIGKAIQLNSGTEFNSWEEWRRSKGRPKLIRVIYYPVISVLPTAVSTVILTLYFGYAFPGEDWKLNIYSVVTSAFVLGTLATALISTITINRTWEKLIMADPKKPDVEEEAEPLESGD